MGWTPPSEMNALNGMIVLKPLIFETQLFRVLNVSRLRSPSGVKYGCLACLCKVISERKSK